MWGDKVEISKTKKKVLIAVEIVLILTLLSFAVSELVIPRYKETDVVHYTYKSRGGIGYKVYLRPNIMFNQKYLEEGRYYIYKYIDYIDMEFEYDYTANSSAELEVEYIVTAYLQGLHGRDNEVLWSKEFPLISRRTQTEENSKLIINESVSVDPNDYSNVAESLYLDSEINAPVVLSVVFSIHTMAKTKYGILEDDISPTLIIPVGNSVFKMEGEPLITGENKISEKVRSELPVNRVKVIILFCNMLVLIVLLLFTGRIKETPPLDIFKKQIASIFKEYSERLAGLEHTIPYQLSESITINSIEDMVKIADEVGQPIFYYMVDNSVERKIEFFVFDNMRTYYLVIFGEI